MASRSPGRSLLGAVCESYVSRSGLMVGGAAALVAAGIGLVSVRGAALQPA